jgi:hypothetical protein
MAYDPSELAAIKVRLYVLHSNKTYYSVIFENHIDISKFIAFLYKLLNKIWKSYVSGYWSQLPAKRKLRQPPPQAPP